VPGVEAVAEGLGVAVVAAAVARRAALAAASWVGAKVAADEVVA